MIRIMIALIAALGFAVNAAAQTNWPTPNGFQPANGAVLMCFNGSGQAIPAWNASGNWQCNDKLAVSATQGTVSHASITVLGTALVVKASAGTLFGFNCSALTGGAAGYCVAYNATAAPGTGALTGSLVLDVCQFDTTARGCSLARSAPIAYSAGIVILVTSAATPFTYTTGTDTAFVSADYQ